MAGGFVEPYEIFGHVDEFGNIKIPRGDTVKLVFPLYNTGVKDWQAGPADRVVFGIRNGLNNEVLHRQVLEIDGDNRASITLENATTQAFPPGEHVYDVRYVENANEDATDGTAVRSRFLRKFTVVEIAAEV